MQSDLGRDGSGVVARAAASRRRPRLVARLLDTDGRFGAGRPLTRTGEPFELGVGVASGAGLPSTVAWTTGRSGNGTVRLRIAALRP